MCRSFANRISFVYRILYEKCHSRRRLRFEDHHTLNHCQVIYFKTNFKAEVVEKENPLHSTRLNINPLIEKVIYHYSSCVYVCS